MLVADGKNAGLFTSPYVTTFTEKIKVGNKYMSAKEYVAIVDYLRPFITKATAGKYGHPSAFELCLAIALLYYQQQKCDWVVLEVGLGGRYDATNVITAPKVTAITNIDYDHTEILGKTLKKIANDKGGIIKKGSAFFTSEQRPALISIFKKICKEQGASFEKIPKQKDYKEYNLLLATHIAKSVGISAAAIEQGIKNVRLPCRFEIVATNPTIILDGAHNRAKIRTTISNLKKLSYKKLFVITGLSDTNNDRLAIIKPLLYVADVFIATTTNTSDRPSMHPNAFKAHVSKHVGKKTKFMSFENPYEALKTAQKLAKEGDCILVTGSFFLAGELRKIWYPEEWVVEHQTSFSSSKKV